MAELVQVDISCFLLVCLIPNVSELLTRASEEELKSCTAPLKIRTGVVAIYSATGAGYGSMVGAGMFG